MGRMGTTGSDVSRSGRATKTHTAQQRPRCCIQPSYYLDLVRADRVAVAHRRPPVSHSACRTGQCAGRGPSSVRKGAGRGRGGTPGTHQMETRPPPTKCPPFNPQSATGRPRDCRGRRSAPQAGGRKCVRTTTARRSNHAPLDDETGRLLPKPLPPRWAAPRRRHRPRRWPSPPAPPFALGPSRRRSWACPPVLKIRAWGFGSDRIRSN